MSFTLPYLQKATLFYESGALDRSAILAQGSTKSNLSPNYILAYAVVDSTINFVLFSNVCRHPNRCARLMYHEIIFRTLEVSSTDATIWPQYLNKKSSQNYKKAIRIKISIKFKYISNFQNIFSQSPEEDCKHNRNVDRKEKVKSKYDLQPTKKITFIK